MDFASETYLQHPARREPRPPLELKSATVRRFQAMCVGTAKSGTHSMAGIFGREYSAAHEPEHRVMIDAILARQDGEVSREQLGEMLLERDRRLDLEMDSSQLNGHLIDLLVELFPEAKFVLTIRDVYSFVNSAIDHHVAHGGGSEVWRRINRVKFGGFEHGRYDGPLGEVGAFPLAGYLSYWVRHNQGVLDLVPAERLLVVRTNEIGESFPSIADFVGIEADTLDVGRAHEYPAVRKLNLLGRLDSAFVEECVKKTCGGLMGKYFPQAKWVGKLAETEHRS